MIEKIKEQIWELLKDKEVSLVMIFDDQGHILWHRGRKIVDTKNLSRGCGFCSTQARQAMQNRNKSLHKNCLASYKELQNIESARILDIKSLVVIPVASRWFLYVDSGVKTSFSKRDIELFESLGSLLGTMITQFKEGKGNGLRISGGSSQVEAIRERIIKFAIEEEPVLILGETGVGKSYIAEMIHQCSGRPGPFLVISTPGIPETLIESQLFGHLKGAFSGAVVDSQGFIAAAENGTLFLDEIGEIDTGLQAKLLRFTDTKKYHRLGETAERKADVRIIAATNRDLPAMVAAKKFREDLFFRLNFLTIQIPPLRERPTDIAVLIDENRELLRGKNLTAEAREILLRYDWPGNIRELFRVLKTAGILFSGKEIGSEVEELMTYRERLNGEISNKTDLIWKRLLSGESFWKAVKEPFLKRNLNREEVITILERGLKETKGKYSGLAVFFNLQPQEYNNFMRFLYDNKLKKSSSD